SIPPLPSSTSRSARGAPGRAASCDRTKAAIISRGSWRYPSLHSRHIDDSAGGSGSLARAGEGGIDCPLLFTGIGESLRLQIEHRAIAAVQRHQLVVRAQFDDASVLEHADAIGVA